MDHGPAFGLVIAFPIGLDKWSIHFRMPVTEPRGETRDPLDVMNDLADRMGLRKDYNVLLDYTAAIRMTPENREAPPLIEPEDRSSGIELLDKIMKYHFDKGRGLEWFRDNGFITWDKKPEECYWRWFVAAVGLGSWAKVEPIARGKGINPNALHREDQDHMDPVSGVCATTVRVKAFKE